MTRGAWAFALILACAAAARAGEPLIDPVQEVVSLPAGKGSLRLDDYYFDRTLARLVVPDGRALVFIDPKTRAADAMPGFGGLTSADGEGGLIFAADRADRQLYVVDGRKRAVLSKTSLSGGPDYVRYVAKTREVWVTEPRDRRIEVFSLIPSSGAFAVPVSSGFIASPDEEFEALVIDAARGRAYSNQGRHTVAIDLAGREIVAAWPNPCKSAEGLALDEPRGFLVVACREGLAAVLDVGRAGTELSSLAFGDGIDIIALSPDTARLLLPGAKSATMAFAALSNEGKLALLGQVKTAEGAHCVAADDAGGAWVCDPAGGRLLYYRDRLAAGMKTRY